MARDGLNCVRGYFWAVALVAAGTLLRFAFLPLLDPYAPYLTFYPPIIVVAVLWGKGPGVFAGLLGHFTADYLFVQPPMQFHFVPHALFSLLVIVSSASFLGHIGERLRQARFQAKSDADSARSAEQRIAALLEASLSGVAVSENGRFVDLNNQFADMLGYERDKLIGMEIEQLIPADEAERVMSNIRSGRESITDHGMIRRDGSRIQVETNGKTIELHGRKVRFTSLYNITARKQIEESLRESRERLRLATTAARLFAFEWNPVTDAVRREGDWADVLGAGFNEETGASYFQRVHPEDRAAFVDLLRSLRPDHDSYTTAYRVLRTGGEVVLEESGRAFFDERGRFVRLMGMTADVTARTQTEAAQHRSEERFRVAQVLSPDGFTILRPVRDAQGRVVDFTWVYENTAIARLNGTDPEAVVGRRLLDVFPGQGESPFLKAYQQVAQTGERCVFEEEFRDERLARPLWLRIATVPIGGDVAVLAQDMTERRHIEEQVRQAKEAAEAANKAKDHFLAVISHELRTPLTPVLATVQVMEMDKDLPPDLRESVIMIRRNVELEARLIDDLLDLTRLSRGKLTLRISTVDLHKKIRNVAHICDSDIRAKQLELSVHLGAERHHVQGDPARVQQMLWNLIRNAVKFTPVRGRIGIRTQDGSDGFVQVIVEDTGVGIEPDRLPHIFDAFEQGGVEVTRLFGGLGLGLSICKGLADLHGGKLTAYSEGKDRGSRFCLELPVSQASGAQEPDDVEPVPTAQSTPTRILLVEDHADTALVMSRLLTRWGYEVVTADSVAAALRKVQSHTFDLLISDLGLPDGSGHDLMRQLAPLTPLKGIVMSGYGMDEDIRKSKAAGFAEHLVKPVDFKLLREMVVRLTQSE